jgi:putative ABC transport system permease protein
VYNQDYVSTLMVQLENTKEEETTAVALGELLRQRHAIQEGEYDDFQLTRPRAAIAQAMSINAGIRRMIIWIGVVALVIGGIVVANLMFAATSDRQTEIGTRRALGATQGDVLQQFWIETVLVACTAGLLGVALSYLAVIVVPIVLDTTLYLPWWVAFGAFAATALVGLIAGLFPARRAAAMPPAVALSVDE